MTVETRAAVVICAWCSAATPAGARGGCLAELVAPVAGVRG